MHKVRWTTRCAGGCGRLLVVGTYAENHHRTTWCLACSAAHVATCSAHDVPERREPVATGSQPRLW